MAEQKSEKEQRIVAEVSTDLKRKAQAKAALDGRSLKDVIEELLEDWIYENEMTGKPKTKVI